MITRKPELNVAKPYDKMTSQERTAIDKFIARSAADPAPRLKVTKGKEIAPHHPDALAGNMLLMDALGTGDLDFFNGLIGQLASASSQGEQINEQTLNFMLSVVKGVQPRDQIEAMLAAQMATVHLLSMTLAGRLARVEDVAQQDSAAGAHSKLTRTFTTQMEALKRHRTGGEQKVTVQDVSVGEGGKAMAGNVAQGARETAPKTALTQQHPTMNEPERAPIPFRRVSKR
jgi:hypothetical protein